MNAEYSDRQSKKFLTESESKLVMMLEREMKRSDSKTAQAFKDIDLPGVVVNNRKNRRKYLYTNNPSHTVAKRDA